MNISYTKKRHIQESNQRLENRMISEKIINSLTVKTINEGYLGRIESGDDLCDIICKRKQAKYGSTGNVVKQIQNALANCGSNVEKQGGGMMQGCKEDYTKCDGVFRDETKKAVEDFQSKNSIKVDGSVGYETLMKLSNNGCIKIPKCECEEKDVVSTGKQENWWELIGIDKSLIDCNKINHCLYQALSSKPAGFDFELFKICIDTPSKKSNEKKFSENPIKENCKNCPTFYNNQPGTSGASSELPPYIQECKRKGCTTIVV
jgi:hypothetical protein